MPTSARPRTSGRISRRAAACLAAVAALSWPGRAAAAATDPPPALGLSGAQVRAALAHGPWPPPRRPDPANRVSGQSRAIALGCRLFFESRLSSTGTISCASCHRPERGWTDGRERATALGAHDRNTQTLWNLAWQRWFGWDGGSDSLWSHSVRPLLAAHEMGASAAHVARVLRSVPELARAYAAAFGTVLQADDTRLLVDVGKAMAAYLETLVSPRTAFDAFRDALERGDWHAAAAYPAAARRGLAIFVGRGRCAACHVGPQFSNGEFHDIGIDFFVDGSRVDPGRHGGIRRVRSDPLNRLGGHGDAPDGTGAMHTRHVRLSHRNWGQFKVPTLRQLVETGPYMHNGSLPDLRAVVRHYSELDLERLHSDGEALLVPLGLSDSEIDDLVAFLRSLSAEAPQVTSCASSPLR
ncbi:MAG: hypothetical protein JSW68_07105 [Burkholderiales bacterium]|nr:MAG: hypothetical protein JSW68_07105 [Burkholderiales bacterium]